MPSTGPCASPSCKDKWNASGQFTLLSAEFCATHPGFTVEQAHCGKRPCQRWVGKLPPLGQGGAQAAKRAAADGGSGVSVAVPLGEALPRPFSVVSINELWAERCAASCPPVCPAASDYYCARRMRACWTGAWTLQTWTRNRVAMC